MSAAPDRRPDPVAQAGAAAPGVDAWIGLGANLGDAAATLRAAIDDLAAVPGVRLAARSSFYRSAPVGADGPDYVNAVVAVTTTLDAPSLLRALQAIEARHGRERPWPNAPRTLDLDLLLHGDAVLDTPVLTLPHPRAHARAFVLVPMAEAGARLGRLPSLPGRAPLDALLAGVADQPIEKLAP